MTTSTEIENAIAGITRVTGQGVLAPVWVYGQMLWGDHPSAEFAIETPREFTATRGRATKTVSLMVDQVKRYRDGETAFFLIELPHTMAAALGIEDFILPLGELDRLRRSIDTTRAF
jgi:hypothetical protein